MSDSTTDPKEQHRRGTIGRWDAPDADWAADYDWTRYRGPKPYPCPGDWVLNLPEEGGAMWYRYPGVGGGHATDDDVADALEPDYDAYNDARGEAAFLTPEIYEDDLANREVTHRWVLTVAGETVFERVDPDETDVWAAAAEALARYDDGGDLDDVVPASGRPTDEVLEQRDIEQKAANNQSLGEF